MEVSTETLVEMLREVEAQDPCPATITSAGVLPHGMMLLPGNCHG